MAPSSCSEAEASDSADFQLTGEGPDWLLAAMGPAAQEVSWGQLPLILILL